MHSHLMLYGVFGGKAAQPLSAPSSYTDMDSSTETYRVIFLIAWLAFEASHISRRQFTWATLCVCFCQCEMWLCLWGYKYQALVSDTYSLPCSLLAMSVGAGFLCNSSNSVQGTQDVQVKSVISWILCSHSAFPPSTPDCTITHITWPADLAPFMFNKLSAFVHSAMFPWWPGWVTSNSMDKQPQRPNLASPTSPWFQNNLGPWSFNVLRTEVSNAVKQYRKLFEISFCSWLLSGDQYYAPLCCESKNKGT